MKTGFMKHCKWWLLLNLSILGEQIIRLSLRAQRTFVFKTSLKRREGWNDHFLALFLFFTFYFYLFIFPFIYISWRLITLQYCSLILSMISTDHIQIWCFLHKWQPMTNASVRLRGIPVRFGQYQRLVPSNMTYQPLAVPYTLFSHV